MDLHPSGPIPLPLRLQQRRKRSCKSAAIKNRTEFYATFQPGFYEGALEIGEGVVLLEGISDGFAAV